jgi:hypothetical protein
MLGERILMLTIPSQIVKVETMSEKDCMKLTLHTNELSPTQKAELMGFHNQFGFFAFAVKEVISEADIPDEPLPEFAGQKTLSERLRNVLFLLHKKQGGKPEDYEFYRQKVMEKLISHYKEKLDD